MMIQGVQQPPIGRPPQVIGLERRGPDLPTVRERIARLHQELNPPAPAAPPDARRPGENPPAPVPLHGAHFERNLFERTDAQAKVLAENISNMAILNILSGGFNTPIPPTGQAEILFEAAAAKAEGRDSNLWDLYKRHHEPNPSFFSSLAYRVLYSSGFLPAASEGLLRNVVNELRNCFENREHRQRNLTMLADGLFKELNSFLDARQQATKDYAEERAPAQDLSDYRHQAVFESDPQQTTKAICRRFASALPNTLFPELSLFPQGCKTIPVLGSFLGFVEKSIGTLKIFLLKRFILPLVLEKVVDNVVEKTAPTRTIFVFSVTQKLKNLIERALSSEPKLTSLPPSAIPLNREPIERLVDKLLENIDLMGDDKKKPLHNQAELRNLIASLNNRADRLGIHTSIRQGLPDTIVQGVAAALGDLAARPDKVENLLFTLCETLNESLVALSQEVSLNDCIREKTELDTVVDRLLKKMNISGPSADEKDGLVTLAFDKEKKTANHYRMLLHMTFKSLKAGQPIPAARIQGYLDELARYPAAVDFGTIDPATQHDFYQSFGKLYQELKDFLNELSDFQDEKSMRQKEAEQDMRLSRAFTLAAEALISAVDLNSEYIEEAIVDLTDVERAVASVDPTKTGLLSGFRTATVDLKAAFHIKRTERDNAAALLEAAEALIRNRADTDAFREVLNRLPAGQHKIDIEAAFTAFLENEEFTNENFLRPITTFTEHVEAGLRNDRALYQTAVERFMTDANTYATHRARTARAVKQGLTSDQNDLEYVLHELGEKINRLPPPRKQAGFKSKIFESFMTPLTAKVVQPLAVTPKIKPIYEGTYQLLTTPDIYKALARTGLKLITKAYRN